MDEKEKETKVEIEKTETKIVTERKAKTIADEKVNQAYEGFGIVSFILGLGCVFIIWLLPMLSLILGIIGAILGMISISKKWSTIGIASIAINITGLSVMLLYFVVCMVLGVSKYALFQ